ncbi:MAG: PaaI family thioesterase, partial [Actinobacteria bacterium]|nr:PaaI family thioesterase [Actinomycetota bacterium]
PDDPPDIGEPAGPDPDPDPPDPHLRQVEGETLPRAVWEELDGLAIMRGLIAGDLPAPPLHHLIGCRPVEASEGSATFVLPATEWLNSPLARVEGGVTAMLGDLAMAAAVQTTVPPATAFATLDLKVNFLRPLASDGREIRAVGTVVHRGKTVAVAGAEVLDPDGKRAALATGSSMLLPGRPMDLRRPVVPEEDGGG